MCLIFFVLNYHCCVCVGVVSLVCQSLHSVSFEIDSSKRQQWICNLWRTKIGVYRKPKFLEYNFDRYLILIILNKLEYKLFEMVIANSFLYTILQFYSTYWCWSHCSRNPRRWQGMLYNILDVAIYMSFDVWCAFLGIRNMVLAKCIETVFT